MSCGSLWSGRARTGWRRPRGEAPLPGGARWTDHGPATVADCGLRRAAGMSVVTGPQDRSGQDASQLDQGQREARADHQKATMFKSSLMSKIIRFM